MVLLLLVHLNVYTFICHSIPMVIFGDVSGSRILLVRTKILGSHQCPPVKGSTCKGSGAPWRAIFWLNRAPSSPLQAEGCVGSHRALEVLTGVQEGEAAVLRYSPAWQSTVATRRRAKPLHLCSGLMCINWRRKTVIPTQQSCPNVQPSIAKWIMLGN